MRSVVVTATQPASIRQTVSIGGHTLVADEPVDQGGEDAGPAPHEWLLAGLGACTSMTVGMYARRKGWSLERVEVTVEGARVDGAFVFRRHLRIDGDLTNEQRERLLEMANKCPVHKTLTGTIVVETDLAPR